MANGYQILTASSAKIDKSVKFGYLTGVLYMIPSDLSMILDARGRRVNLCPAASAGCKASCLVTAGRASMCKETDKVTGLPVNTIIKARQRRTEMYVRQRDAFCAAVLADLGKLIRYAGRKGLTAAFRFNGTSDVPWWRIDQIASPIADMVAHGDLVTYDYTKCPAYLAKCPTWHDLTLSRSETNADKVNDALNSGARVAAVFAGKPPQAWEGYQVVDGDKHDLCFLHPGKVILGLKAKGRAKKDETGFTIRNYEDNA